MLFAGPTFVVHSLSSVDSSWEFSLEIVDDRLYVSLAAPGGTAVDAGYGESGLRMLADYQHWLVSVDGDPMNDTLCGHVGVRPQQMRPRRPVFACSSPSHRSADDVTHAAQTMRDSG